MLVYNFNSSSLQYKYNSFALTIIIKENLLSILGADVCASNFVDTER